MTLLQVSGASKRFGSLVAIEDVSLTIEPGELRAIIGPNGAGKTTFFNLVSGLFAPTSGSIRFEGQDVTGFRPTSACKRGMARTFQITEIFPELSVADNIRVAVEIASGYRLKPWLGAEARADVEARVSELLSMGGLADKRDVRAGALTHGDQRAAEIMMSLALRPRLLMLDEPTAGMGDQETYDIARLIRRLHRQEGLTIMLIEHDMRVVFNLADRIMVLAEGRVLAEGAPQEIADERKGPGRLSRQGGRMIALKAEAIHAFYGKSHVLHGVSLEVREGEIVALLGRNGAGKTTTLRSLIGLNRPRPGRVELFGADVTGFPPYRIAAMGVGYVPEGRRIFANLTVDENLLVPVERQGPWTVRRVYEAFPRLAERRTNKGGQLSGGEQEMLSIARALLLNPKLLMLDEPSQGLAPLIVEEVLKIIAAARREGVSVLLVEQNVRAAVEIADRAYVLDDGRVVYEGDARAFGSDERRVRELAGASAEKWDMGD